MTVTKWLIVFTLTAVTGAATGQVDNIGSGRALSFDGVDDYVEYGEVYHTVSQPISVSAWIFMSPDPIVAAPIFVSNDNTDLTYRGFWFVAGSDWLYFQIGDGKGGNNPAFRRGKQAFFSNITGRWVHVAAVYRSPTDIDLYVNGMNVGGNYIGGSSSPMANPFPGDTPKIGKFFSNFSLYYFKGAIDEVRLWNRSLTQSETRSQMCRKLAGNEAGLIGYWSFDETSGAAVNDKSSTLAHGTVVGNPARVFSGAPIGDESSLLYTSSWSGQTLELGTVASRLVVSDVVGNPWGAHIYRVGSLPSQTTGLPLGEIDPPYFGVFLAAPTPGPVFQATHISNGVETLNLFQRNNNSVANWMGACGPKVLSSDRQEFIPGLSVEVSLGPDLAICDGDEITLKPQMDPTGFTFLWQDGSTQPELVATKAGVYWVKVTTGCIQGIDTVILNRYTIPLSVDLGDDVELCKTETRTIGPALPSGTYAYLWQDSTTLSELVVNKPGIYWVRVNSGCAEGTDSVAVALRNVNIDLLPNVITPNGDNKNQHFFIDSLFGAVSFQVINRWGQVVFEAARYTNTWDGGDLAAGVYYYRIEGGCVGEVIGNLTIIR